MSELGIITNMKQAIYQFLQSKNIAVVGMSSKSAKFGNLAYKELSKKDYQVFPIHPNAKKIDGVKCYKGFNEIAETLDGVLISVPPSETEKVVEEAHTVGIKNVWLQQGAQSDKAINYCKENSINVVNNECILMFAEPITSFHKIHHFVWKVLGKLPK